MRAKKLFLCMMAGVMFGTSMTEMTAFAAQEQTQGAVSIQIDNMLSASNVTTGENEEKDIEPVEETTVKEDDNKAPKKKKTVKKKTTKASEKKKYTAEELKYLACLVHSEAGNQSYTGKLAVAYVVLNRMKSRAFPSSMKSVIYDKGQFTVARNGMLSRELGRYKRYTSSKAENASLKAAKEALENGFNKRFDYLFFTRYSTSLARKHRGGEKIGAHYFW